ncbi:MAG TPA: molybdopterin-dependent oxidoreductase [Polyangiaceae bacterium]|nr:molybdopterin-dependent oxidoreductase [Polyangiaceae bacterium]
MKRTGNPEFPHLEELMARRRFIQRAGAGALTIAFGGVLCYFADDLTTTARAESRSDGRPRLPPGQRVLERLKPMGGDAGDANPAAFRLRVHGEVEKPFTLSFRDLLALPQTERRLDVHCVTGWSVLGARFGGVTLKDLAARAKPKPNARYVVLEAAHGYTANLSLREALKPNVLVAHRLDGAPLPRAHGAPVRAVVPDLYFWKSAKWLTGVRFTTRDEPGYWETRGYSNHADPWQEERYA